MKRFFLLWVLIASASALSASAAFAAEAAPSDRGEFIGTWTMRGSEGEDFQAILNADGTSTSDWGPGETGTWQVIDGKAYVTWTDGWKEIIERDGAGYRKYGFEPGKDFTDQPSNESEAVKSA